MMMPMFACPVDRETGDFEPSAAGRLSPMKLTLNENNQVPISEAKEQDPEVEVGDFLELTAEPVDFIRIGAQAAWRYPARRFEMQSVSRF